jgi:hypothetical protein
LINTTNAAETAATARQDQEDMRLVTGFADIFAAIVLVGGLIALLGLVGQFIGAGAGLVGLVAVWFLTVPLVEQRRFAATAIILALSFAFTIAIPSFALLGSFGALIVAGASYFYWQRFKIPLTAALGIAFAVGFPALLVLGFLDAGIPWFGGFGDLDDFPFARVSSTTALFVGLALFAIAMRWDISDRERKTRRSDVAFWLHLLAGPLTVHGLFSLLGVARFDADIVNPWPIIALFLFFTLTALIIDRRPLLIASFGYFLFALGQIIYRQVSTGEAPSAISIPQAIMAAALAGGLLVAILAGAWSGLRGLVLRLIPAALAERVPPAHAAWTPSTSGEAQRPASAPSAGTAYDAPGESEPLRLVLGLNDYLATLGLGVLFIGGLVASYVIMAQQMVALPSDEPLAGAQGFVALWAGPQPWLALLVPAAIVLIAAEVFVRRQRMALTAVFAANLFALLSILASLLFVWQQNIMPQIASAMANNPFAADDFRLSVAWIAGTAIAAALLNWGFGWINRIPVSAAWGMVMLVPLLFVDVIASLDNDGFQTLLSEKAVQLRLVGFGGLLFVAALLLDRSDPARRTQRADVAFWLHLLASLFVVIILFAWVEGWFGTQALPGFAATLLFALLTIAALVINRRAPLVVGIPFVLTSLDWLGPDGGMLARLLFFAALMALVLKWDQVRAWAAAKIGRPLPAVNNSPDRTG